ncbi:ABC-F family ATP-binding cassette domain-containing protein [Actinotalea sp. BY-33]|uniref:ABC-F family ATP-binding cassette domain-containing protein n=1 Tax=Actinotalea soli TaxID=2819234 RepID=A0A939LQU7_9CELL|nr:ABC-F family ATP-binding cassette domain-containing protein [Actinotalea soli]MBO1751340.1 ABC-F family ATP-binding cassette domain-containing protein [Actinotalea soli]
MPRSLPSAASAGLHSTGPYSADPLTPTTGPVLRAEGISVSFAGRPVLTDLSLAVDPGHRVGLVGENGSGKSTLLRVLAGDLDPDVGEVHRPPDLGWLRQEVPLTTRTTVANLLDDALTQVRALVSVVERAGLALADPALADPTADDAATHAYDLALRRAELADAWDVDHRLDLLLEGLGVADLARDRRLLELSGGERTRISLAALLVRRPGALLLDEPTNHLDDEAAEFLAAQVRALPGAVLLASHDRVLLDEVCTSVLDLDPTPGGPVLTRGGYGDHRSEQQVRREQWEQRHAAEQEELADLRRAVTGVARRVAPGRGPTDGDKMQFDFKAGRVQQQLSRRVRNAQRRLDELEAAQVRKPPPRLTFRSPTGGAPNPDAAGELVVWLRDVVVPGRLVAPRLEVAAGRPLLVTGPNGSGKSTLLAVIAGDLEPAQGTVQRRRGVEVALLEQDVHLAAEERTPRELYALATAGLPDAPRLVELGLIPPRDVDRPVGTLSVGQRRRVVLAMVVARRPGLLLLDEPTNHISLALADELQDALQVGPGAVVVASHDRWLRRRWVGEEVVVRDGRL